jgi:hypothetical protein
MYVPIGGFKNIYKLDFKAQTTQNLIGGGNFTIDGKTWTVENQGNASAFSLTNGTGLVITTNSGTPAYQPNDRNAPLIRVDVPSLVGNLSFVMMKALRFRARVVLTNSDTNFEVAHLAIEWALHPRFVHLVSSRGWIVSAIQNQNGMCNDTVDPGATDNETRDGSAVTSDDVLELVWGLEWMKESRHSLFASGAFPRLSTLQSSMFGNVPTIAADTVKGVMQNTTGSTLQPRMALAAAPTSSANSFTATFTNLQIDQLVN